MKRHIVLRVIFMMGLFFVLLPINAQELEMIFETKDFSGNIMPLNERLDSEMNHLILFSAFWCAPCVTQINNKHSKNIKNYRDNYNLKVILLDDDNYETPDAAISKIRDNQWYFDMYMTDGLYGSLGVPSIPRYFFLPAGETEAFRVSTSSFLDEIEEYYEDTGYASIFFEKNKQVVSKNNECEEYEVVEFGDGQLSTEIGDHTYFNISGINFRKDIISKNIIRHEPFSQTETVVFDYYLSMCDNFTLKDHEGDELELAVEYVNRENGEISIETDAMISDGCGENVPFVMNSVYGSNAGILFDIEDGVIVTRLLCHSQNNEVLYSSEMDMEACDLALNLSPQMTNSEISISNNPGNGVFKLRGIDKGNSVEIFNAAGIRVKSIHKNFENIDISKFESGFYIVKILGTEKKALKYILLDQ